MTTFDPSQLDFANMDAAELARLVKTTPKDELEQLMTGEHRNLVLDEIFAQMARRVRKDKITSMDAIIRWRISGRPDGEYDRYELHIANGGCTVGPGSEGQPRLTITTDGVNFLRLVSGNASGPTLFMTKKLQLAGDLALGAGLTNYFDIPKA
ncbi:SCP2 sterol-binding domain-containing protein [Fodinicola feengrottensis]|uniref:SCP2 domain-containing protein n=1 Tax=Fodinicola feengrottensis TaxID=435914 RepID=A0ABP4TPI2_9ACTN|nr:SCP2 sterol-binding domain-containing protein [Fodinicola feengrottensis]